MDCRHLFKQFYLSYKRKNSWMPFVRGFRQRSANTRSPNQIVILRCCARGHMTKRMTWQTPQTRHNSAQHELALCDRCHAAWASGAHGWVPAGHPRHTHGTPVLITIRKPWVAQPHEHAHAIQVTDTSCQARVATKQHGGGARIQSTHNMAAEHPQRSKGARVQSTEASVPGIAPATW